MTKPPQLTIQGNLAETILDFFAMRYKEDTAPQWPKNERMLHNDSSEAFRDSFLSHQCLDIHHVLQEVLVRSGLIDTLIWDAVARVLYVIEWKLWPIYSTARQTMIKLGMISVTASDEDVEKLLPQLIERLRSTHPPPGCVPRRASTDPGKLPIPWGQIAYEAHLCDADGYRTGTTAIVTAQDSLDTGGPQLLRYLDDLTNHTKPHFRDPRIEWIPGVEPIVVRGILCIAIGGPAFPVMQVIEERRIFGDIAIANVTPGAPDEYVPPPFHVGTVFLTPVQRSYAEAYHQVQRWRS